MRKEIYKIYKDLVCPFLANFMCKDFCAILMFHRIADIGCRYISANEHLKVSPAYFEWLIRDLKRHGFAFLSMDEVVDGVRQGMIKGKTVAITFDDGYLDNFTTGQQILQSENVPGIVYVATGLRTGEAPLWWNVLEDYLLETASEGEPDLVLCQRFLKLRDWAMQLPPDSIRSEFANRFGLVDADFEKHTKLLADDAVLRRFVGNKLLSVGCHTHRHVPCGLLPYGVVCQDIDTALSKLRSNGLTIRHMAFPFGDDVSDGNLFREYFSSRGIESVVTTFPGIVNARSDRLFMPRLFVSQLQNFSTRIIDIRRCDRLKALIRTVL